MSLTKVSHSMISGTIFSPLDYGAVGNGSTDDYVGFQAAITAAGASGGIVDGGALTYCIDTGNLVINYDNVIVQNCTLKRTNSSNTGYTLRFATTTNTTGGGVINVKFIGIPTLAANAGLGMGTATYKANKYIIDNVEATLHGQYGVGIEAGDNWRISNVRVTEHGLTSGAISSCIGFYVYPKIASSGGQLNNVSAELSAGCVANASANTAAIKLQTHQQFTGTNIRAVSGSEQACSIDSIQGIIRNLYVVQSGSDAGLAVGNYNPAHSFSGQKFTLDGFVVQGSGSAVNNEFLIAGGDNGQYKLTGCIVRNGKAGGAGFLALSNTKDCVFENLSFGDMRFSAANRGYSVNSAASTNNIYRNVTVDGSAGGGVLAIETSNSLIENCGGIAADTKTVSNFVVYGDSNEIVTPSVINGSTNAIQIVGDSNLIFNPTLSTIVGRSIFFPSGSDNNIIYGANNLASVGTGILNSGTNNLVYSFNPTVVADVGNASSIPSWISGQRTFVWNTALTADQSVTLNTASVPNGARYRIVRTANATGAFNLNVGTGPLKALTAGQWCDVDYNGSAWVLTAFGSL